MNNFNKSALVTSVVDGIALSCKVFTKQLKFMPVAKNSDKLKCVVSSELLERESKLAAKDRYIPVELGLHKGMEWRRATEEDVRAGVKTLTVSSRTYKNGRVEPLIDYRNQKIMASAFGAAKEVHVTFMRDRLILIPVFEGKDDFVGDPVKLLMNDEMEFDELNTTIFNAIDYVKEVKAAKVYIDFGPDFSLSQQSDLLVLQLRRMGYVVTKSQTNRRTLTASMMPQDDDGDADDVASVSLGPLKYDAEHHKDVLAQAEKVNDLKECFFACSSGVDIFAMESEGYTAKSLLEYRPNESRDYKTKTCKKTGKKSKVLSDRSDSGALCASNNSKGLVNIFNEDIYKFDIRRVRTYLDAVGNGGIFHISLQCDEFSACKSKGDKEKSLVNMESTVDMVFPALDLIKELKMPMVVVENVPGFSSSLSCALFEAKLESMGYTVHKKIMSALDHNGYTSRKRMMLFGTAFNDVPFEFPEKEVRKANVWNDVVLKNLNRFRDVSHTKGSSIYWEGKSFSQSYDKAKELSKPERTLLRKYQCSNVISAGASYCGTLLKSQNRQVAETFYIELDGKLYMPDNDVLKELMSIGSNFCLGGLTKELGTEVVCQSVDARLHRAFTSSVSEHIAMIKNLGADVLKSVKRKTKEKRKTVESLVKDFIPNKSQHEIGEQYSLF